MSDIVNPVEWQKPENEKPYHGRYFVAVKYPVGLGTYDFIEWDGEKWLIDYEGEVIGWVSLTDFMKSLKAGWPAWDNAS